MTNKYLYWLIFHFYIIFYFIINPSFAVLHLDTGEAPEIIDQRSVHAARPYAQVCRLAINNEEFPSGGSGTLVGRKGRELWILTAAHCIWHKQTEAFCNEVDAIFTLEDGRQIICPGLVAFIPKFGPTNLLELNRYDKDNVKTDTTNNDIAVLKCLLPDQVGFPVTPMEILDSQNGTLNRFQGKFIGYGKHGVNGSDKRELDNTRRLGETNLIEYRKDPVWTIMSCLLASKEGGFDQNYDEFSTEFILDNEDIRKPNWGDFRPRLKEKLHSRQGLVQGGDSGGPLLVARYEKEGMLGVSVNEQRSTLGPLNTNFTPVSYYKDWIKNILEGNSPSDTYRCLLPNVTPSTSRGMTITFKTKSGVHGLLAQPVGLYVFGGDASKERISYVKDDYLFTVQGQAFSMDSYPGIEEAFNGLMSSGLFEEVKIADIELPAEALAQPLAQKFINFQNNVNFYSQEDQKSILNQFGTRFKELKEKGLEDSRVPLGLRDLIKINEKGLK